MSDENDRPARDDDVTRAAARRPADDDTRIGDAAGSGDATRTGSAADDDATGIGSAADDDATRVSGAASAGDATRVGDAVADDGTPRGVASVPDPDDEDTFPGRGSRDDDTLDDVRGVPTVRDVPPVADRRPDATAVMPPVDDDWARSRANPAWSGRAEVRPPQPGRGYPEVDWSAAATPERRDRWWMPIVVGIIALVLLAVLGWAIYLIVRNVDDEPAPVQSATTAATPAETVTTQSTPPSTEPTTATTTTSAAPMPSTTEPTITEVLVPALRGLALPEAQAALNTTGLNYRLIYRKVDAPAGTVIDSDPAEGQEVPPDTVVTLVVAAEGQTATPTATDGEPEEGGD